MSGSDSTAVLRLLRRRITSGRYPAQTRLPAERDLALEFGVSRGTLRKALAVIEAEGLVWRHVGKGTFVGQPAVRVPLPFELNALAVSPRDLMEARIMFEPVIAARAANDATRADIDFMRKCVLKSDGVTNWRTFELWDRTLHRGIAAATRNPLAVAFLDIVNQIRERDDWSRRQLPPIDSFTPRQSKAVHTAIVEAIAARRAREAAFKMKRHLELVYDVYFSEDAALADL